MGITLDYIDGQTPLDEEEKNGLKLKSITTQGELDQFEQLNIEKAIEWIISTHLKPERIVSEKFVKQLHKKMYGDVWQWAGNFRETNKNIGIHWTQIDITLRTLLDDTRYWIEHMTFLPEEISIRFKHRLVAIHCFPNGNERHSRVMADTIMESIFNKAPFSWNKSNMVKADETRKQYIEALKKADNGHINPLVEFAKG